jgi:Mn2+/Fe2+ NRAMP family transporter
MITTAATLNAHGITNIETSSQAAEALRPIAGDFAYQYLRWASLAWTVGGTGACRFGGLVIGEAWRAPVGLTRSPQEALTFTLLSGSQHSLEWAQLHPDKPDQGALLSAVLNGVVALPIIVILMMMTARQSIMGEFTIRGWLRALGWVSTEHGACVVGMR